MTIEKFVDTELIDPVYYDAAYFIAPDGDAGRDVYAVLREAIAKTGNDRFARVVISQRERTIALRPSATPGHGPHPLRGPGLNSSKDLFDGLAGIKIDPEMVQLATQLVQRQAGNTTSADLEDRYETSLRAMIDAKLKGEGIDLEAEEPVASTSNVIDLMAALKKSLGQTPAEQPAAPKRKKAEMHVRPGSSCRSRAARSNGSRLRPRPNPRASGPESPQLLPNAGRKSALPSKRRNRPPSPRPGGRPPDPSRTRDTESE